LSGFKQQESTSTFQLGQRSMTMIRSLRLSLGCVSLLGLGIGGCSSAAAAEGDAGSTSTRTALAASAKTTPSMLADAPPPGHKPPQEAFDACKGSTEGAACSVTFHNHTLNGTCKKGPDGDDALACAPDHPPGPPPAGGGESLGSSALEQRLDRLEKDIQGPPL
jgi:hypothetical protein